MLLMPREGIRIPYWISVILPEITFLVSILHIYTFQSSGEQDSFKHIMHLF